MRESPASAARAWANWAELLMNLRRHRTYWSNHVPAQAEPAGPGPDGRTPITSSPPPLTHYISFPPRLRFVLR